MQTFAWVSIWLLAATPATHAVGVQTTGGGNPMKRVINMLQMMQKKIEQEGEEVKETYEKFMCFCESKTGELSKSIEDLEERIPQLKSELEEAVAEEGQLKQELVDHKSDRKEAQKALDEATEMREKERKAFAAEEADTKSNIAALGKAIPAIAKGMSQSLFIQTDMAARIRMMLMAMPATTSIDRAALTSFLSVGAGSQDSESEPSSGEILGIMKQMKEDMEGDLKDLIEKETSAQSEFDQLSAAKTKEVTAATKAIEEKTARLGEVTVSIVELKKDIQDSEEGLEDDKNMLISVKEECATKTKDYEATSKMRSMELLAIADTIKLLNDDDAMELFKKTLPSPNFLQTSSTSARRAALRLLGRGHHGDARMNFIAANVRNKKVKFDKVVKMIDDMHAILGEEQAADDTKKEYCRTELDKNGDEKEDTETKLKDLSAKAGEFQEALKKIDADIEGLKAGIVGTDAGVAEATAIRKQEHAEFMQLMQENNAAVQLIEMAKNRLNKFYNPVLYKPPPKKEMSEAERIQQNMMGASLMEKMPFFTQVRARTRARSEDAAEAFSDEAQDTGETFGFVASYQKKENESGGVMKMMDMMKEDLQKEMDESKVEEKDSQAGYEEMISIAAEKREADMKAITAKEAAKAGATEELNLVKKDQTNEMKELADTNALLAQLHEECDFLLKSFDVRKEARAQERDALMKGKAVLAGADFNLLQAAPHKQ